MLISGFVHRNLNLYQRIHALYPANGCDLFQHFLIALSTLHIECAFRRLCFIMNVSTTGVEGIKRQTICKKSSESVRQLINICSQVFWLANTLNNGFYGNHIFFPFHQKVDKVMWVFPHWLMWANLDQNVRWRECKPHNHFIKIRGFSQLIPAMNS